MSTLDQIRSGLTRAWDTLTEGWEELTRRAGHALTHFNPVRGGGLETAEEQKVARGARWGLLAAEVRDDGDAVEVRLEAPGMEPDQFDLQVFDERFLVVRGEKRVEREETRGQFHVMECAYGSFERAIELPAPVEEQGTRARYRRGVLRITLPKKAASRARRIPIEAN